MPKTETTEKKFSHLDTWTDSEQGSMCPYCMKIHDVEKAPQYEGHEIETECPSCEKPYVMVGFVQTCSKTSYRSPNAKS